MDKKLKYERKWKYGQKWKCGQNENMNKAGKLKKKYWDKIGQSWTKSAKIGQNKKCGQNWKIRTKLLIGECIQ